MILRYAVILITQWGRLESRSRCFIIVMKHQVKVQYVLRRFKIVPQQKKSDEILMSRPQIYSLLGTPCNSVYYNSAAINPPFVKVMLLSLLLKLFREMLIHVTVELYYTTERGLLFRLPLLIWRWWTAGLCRARRNEGPGGVVKSQVARNTRCQMFVVQGSCLAKTN